jgi:hypothetical protein
MTPSRSRAVIVNQNATVERLGGVSANSCSADEADGRDDGLWG